MTKHENEFSETTKAQNEISKKTYFPTMVYQIQIGDAEQLNKKLLKSICSERDRDREGIARSNYKELGGWHSQNFLHRDENYKELVGHINDPTTRMSEDMGYSKKHHMRIGTMWSIINPPGSSNRAHVHPGCLWSGVYYIQAPENAGRIEFIDPRTAHLMNQPRYKPNAKRKREYWTKVRFLPKPGRMLIFPAWLYHAVDPNMTKETGDAGNRIIISFNMNQVKA